MDIDLAGFSAAQQRALFDLLILAMYADGHLSSFEDGQLQAIWPPWDSPTSLTGNANLMRP